METLKRMPFKAKNAVFKKLEEVVDVASLNREDRVQYDRSLKAYRDYKNTIDFAKEEGEERGRMEGRMEGRKEGLKEGEERGKMEGLKEGESVKARLIAKSMKTSGEDISKISLYTGLSEEEIQEL